MILMEAVCGAVKSVNLILFIMNIIRRSIKSLFQSPSFLSWKSTGNVQKTLAGCVQRTGETLHSGMITTVKLCPESAHKGRYFTFMLNVVPASIEFAIETPLCTTLEKGDCKIQTVEHLLSALEAMGVDNCRIEIDRPDATDLTAEIPILDGSATEWVKAIGEVGTVAATDHNNETCGKMAAFLNEPLLVWRKDSLVAAFPSSNIKATYGIYFPEVPSIGRQWFSCAPFDDYASQIASSRTFCIFEEVEQLRNAGLIKGGSLHNAIVCSSNKGWLNPPLRFREEPCRHKLLDLIGDFSLLARRGSQGVPVADIVAFKAGHSLHLDFVRRLHDAI